MEFSYLFDKIAGSLLLGAVGDCVGKISMSYPSLFECGMYLPEKLPSCPKFTCATQMTLFTCEGLIHGYNRGVAGGISSSSEVYILDAYMNYLHCQGFPQRGTWFKWSDLVNCSSIKILPREKYDCTKILASGFSGALDNQSESTSSPDAGGVMRCAPLGFILPFGSRYNDYPDDAPFWQGVKACALTHTNPLGYIPGGILAEIIRDGIDKPDTTLVESAAASVLKMERLMKTTSKSGSGSEINDIVSNIRFSIQKAVQLSKPNFIHLPLNVLTKTGSDAATVLSCAIACVLRSQLVSPNVENQPSICICSAASLYDKSSSLPVNIVASLAGQIIGSRIGMKNIPDFMLDFVEDRQIVLHIAEEMAQAAEEMRLEAGK